MGNGSVVMSQTMRIKMPKAQNSGTFGPAKVKAYMEYIVVATQIEHCERVNIANIVLLFQLLYD